MPNIGMSELLLIGLVALIVIGPKDLPGMFRTLGRITARIRSLGREFTRAMHEAADESGMTDAAKTLKAATNPRNAGLDALKDAADRFEKWDPSKALKPETEKPVDKAAEKPAMKPGGETEKLAAERAEQIQNYRDLAAQKAEERIARQKAAEPDDASSEPEPKPSAKKTPAKKPAARKSPAKTAPAKKPATKKAPAKTGAAQKTSST